MAAIGGGAVGRLKLPGQCFPFTFCAPVSVDWGKLPLVWGSIILNLAHLSLCLFTIDAISLYLVVYIHHVAHGDIKQTSFGK